MRTITNRIILFSTAIIIFSFSALLPAHRVYSSYRYPYELPEPMQLQSYSIPYLALNSILAIGGIWIPSPSFNDYFIETHLERLRHYPINRVNDRNFMEVPIRTLRRVWDDAVWWIENGLDYWQRQGLSITPPVSHPDLIGTVSDVPIILEDRSWFTVNSLSPFISGPTSAVINNVRYQIVQPPQPFHFHRLYVNDVFTSQWGGTSDFRHKTFIISMTSGGLMRLGNISSTFSDIWGDYSISFSLFNPAIVVNPILMRPPPQPIILQPINIIDSTINVINIINEITNAYCDDCTVLIWLPDDPPELIGRPISEIVARPPSSDNDDDDGFFRRFWDNFWDNFTISWPTLPSFTWPSFPSFTWPSLPSFTWPSMPDWLTNWQWPSLPDFSNFISFGLENFFSGFLDILSFPDFQFDFTPMLDSVPNFLDYFPFSLPFDLYNIFRVSLGNAPMETIGMTNREANAFITAQLDNYEAYGIAPAFINQTAPRFEMHIPEPFNYTFVVDMNDYPQMIAVIRWSILIIFAVGMIKTTPRFLM